MKHATLIGLFLVALASTASATTVLRVSLQKMTVSSDVILHGEVLSSRAVTVDNNPRNIRTEVHVRVRDLLKGPRGMTELTLQLAGGKVGDWAMKVPGMPTFSAGEQVVLFLEKTAHNWALTGLGQGKFAVVTGPDGVRRVRRQLDGMRFMGYDAKGRFQAVQRPADGPQQTLAALLAEVRHTLQAVKAAQ